MATGRSFGDFVTRRSQLLGKRLSIVGCDRREDFSDQLMLLGEDRVAALGHTSATA